MLLAFAAPAYAQDDARTKARAHFEKGEALFRSGQYEQAIREFETADALVPSPILTYNIGLAHEKLGHDEQALALFEKYLKQRPDAPNKAAVEGRIAAARDRIAAKKQPIYQELDEGPPPPVDPNYGVMEEQAPPRPPEAGPAAPRPRTPGPVPLEDPLARRIPARGGPAEQAPVAPPQATPPGATTESVPAPEPEPVPDPGAEDSQSAAAATPPPPSEPPSRPAYKEWWFWAVVGVSAIVVVSFASSGTVEAAPTLFTF